MGSEGSLPSDKWSVFCRLEITHLSFEGTKKLPDGKQRLFSPCAPAPFPESPFLIDFARIGAAYHLFFGEGRARRLVIGDSHHKRKALSPVAGAGHRSVTKGRYLGVVKS